MPTNKSQLSRYVIPDELDPEGVCCVSVPVPDNPQWRAMFLGALWRLSLQTHYERDAAHNGKVIAARWRNVYEQVRDGMTTCNPPSIINRTILRQNLRLQLRLEFVANGLNGIAPDRPDTFFNEDSGDAGDEIQQRENALCNACFDYVNTISQDIWDIALGTGVTITTFATPILFAVNPIAAAAAAVLAMVITQEVLDAVADETNRISIACCMYDNLQGEAVTQANFESSLTGCGFGPLTQVEIMRDAVEATLNDDGNWYAFVSVMGGFMAASTAALAECVCTETFTHIFDFTIDDQDWENRAEDARAFGVYNPGVGWRSIYWNVGAEWDERLYMQIADFPSRILTYVKFEYTTTGPEGGDGREDRMWLKLADVEKDTQNFGPFDVPSTYESVWEGEILADEIETSMVGDMDNDTSEFTLFRVVVKGLGADPF